MILCQCGCGGEIIIYPHHKYTGIPKYINGHNSKTNNPMYGIRLLGESNGNWKGGITKLNNSI